MTKFRSPLSVAKGMGSAKEGSGHWIAQRITAIALIPLILAEMYYFASYDFTTYEKSIKFIQNPVHAIGGILLYIAAFYHGSLGMQVIIEDYVSCKIGKSLAIILVKLFCYTAIVVGIFSILSIYFKG